MLIDKKLNNNSVFAFDGDVLKIVVGKGIGFNFKSGEEIPPEAIEKIFVPSDKTSINHLESIIEHLSLDELRLGEELLTIISNEFDIKTQNTFMFSLLEHINFAVKRFSEGLVIKSPIQWEVRQYYKKEFEIGMKVLEVVNERLSVDLPDSEAVLIALHFVNAQFDKETLIQTIEFTELTSKIISIIKYHFLITIDENSYVYTRFLTHLRYYMLRIHSGDQILFSDDDVVGLILGKFPKELDCADKIANLIYNTYGVETPDQEKMYLVLHIRCLTQRV